MWPGVPDPNEPEFVGVVVAAGRSTRLAGARPKQFEDLGGRSVLERSVRLLADRPGVRGVVVVLPAAELSGARAETIRSWSGVLDVVSGGATRADSVRCGVAGAADSPYVLIHDAARPLASSHLVDSVIAATREHGAAIPARPVPDTVKQLDASGAVQATLDRARLRLAQTPQGSRTDWLVAALDAARRDGVEVTDESEALERAGLPVALVAGDPDNRKITTVEDLETMRRSLDRLPALRVGSGFDIHRFDPDRPLVLGGLTFPGEPGLAGHSDADVVLHAAMDALLGAAGLGDIGQLFPPEEPRFAGADSARLAAEVAGRLRQAGFEIVNLDITLLAERPRIRDRSMEMREAIGDCLAVATDRIGLKATTLEKLGALGRAEGIACQAVALIHRVAGAR